MAISPNDQANFDSAMALFAESLPPMWRRMYLKLVGEGFKEEQALRLVSVYILSQCPNGIRPS